MRMVSVLAARVETPMPGVLTAVLARSTTLCTGRRNQVGRGCFVSPELVRPLAPDRQGLAVVTPCRGELGSPWRRNGASAPAVTGEIDAT